jgi:mRNA interferase MazF
MRKDFEDWHKVKSWIDEYNHRRFYYEREIWWCHTGLNVGTEMDGKGFDFSRPILVIKSIDRNSFLGVPLTTKMKDTPYHCEVSLGDNFRRMCVLSQVRYFDTRRFSEKMGMLDMEQFKVIRQKVVELVQQPFVHPPSEPSEGKAEAKDAGNPAIPIL